MASSRSSSTTRRKQQRWCPPPLTPLMEGPDHLNVQHQGTKKETSWELIRDWFRAQKSVSGGGGAGVGGGGGSNNSPMSSLYGNNHHNNNVSATKRQDLRLLLGVLGCPLAPIPLVNNPIHHLHIKDIPIENSAAHYILQQYLAATGCLKQQTNIKNMYSVGTVKMICCPTEISNGKNVKSLGTRSDENNGCFVLWQMLPGMWSLELVVGGDGGGNNKVVAGSDGKIVWRHTPWLGTHAAKGPQRPLRRLIQGLDPKSTASLFAKAQCLGEKRIGDEDCFVLKVAADRAAVMERNEGPAEVIRHVLYGYFSQKSGLLIYMEDSHLTRVVQAGDLENNDHRDDENDAAVYWETTIGSAIGDYKDVDGVMIAHQGRTIATVFRFGETSMQHCRTRMEEVWQIHDVVYNVPGLSIDSFIPPADIFQPLHSP